MCLNATLFYKSQNAFELNKQTEKLGYKNEFLDHIRSVKLRFLLW